jgi:hypothetical protein
VKNLEEFMQMIGLWTILSFVVAWFAEAVDLLHNQGFTNNLLLMLYVMPCFLALYVAIDVIYNFIWLTIRRTRRTKWTKLQK